MAAQFVNQQSTNLSAAEGERSGQSVSKNSHLESESQLIEDKQQITEILLLFPYIIIEYRNL